MKEISTQLKATLKDALMDQFMPRFKIDFNISNLKYILSLSYLHNGVWYERTASLDEDVKDKIEDGYNFTIEDGVVVLGEKL